MAAQTPGTLGCSERPPRNCLSPVGPGAPAEPGGIAAAYLWPAVYTEMQHIATYCTTY